MSDDNIIDVLTPVAASVLFGRSDESVRRAVAEGLVHSPVALQFGAQAIRLIDLESARAYWMRTERPSYREPFAAEVERMRSCGITFSDSSEIDRYCVLHPFPLAFDPSKDSK
ncbi:MAG: hypothetical protein OXO52_22705 [Rhodospirillales bacterium]|nr:hypothetical protein [Rhodospirillales bacterium]MDE0382014.1 hypothetical protein [Rhodospirillales bacterium]